MVLLFVVSVDSSQVCSASVAVCCLHCFHCRFALALDTVVWTFLVVRESHSLSLAQCELCMLHVPRLCAFPPCLQIQLYFPSMIVLVSCLRRVKNLRTPNWVAGLLSAVLLVTGVSVCHLVKILVLCLAQPGWPLSVWLVFQVIVISVLGFLESNVYRRNSFPEVLRCQCCPVFVTDLIALSR